MVLSRGRVLALVTGRRCHVVVCPIAMISTCAAVGVALEYSALINRFYASPLVVAIAVASVRHGVRGGLVAALFSAAIWNCVFVPPAWAWNLPTPDEWMAYGAMLGAALVGLAAPREQDQTPPPIVEIDRERLPFQATRRDKSNGSSAPCWWDVSVADVWHEDCQVGAEYGRIFVDAVRARQATPMLGWIVRDMIKAGRFTGVECGFLSGVSAAILPPPPHTHTQHWPDRRTGQAGFGRTTPTISASSRRSSS